jgi:hypothetical protein
MIGSSKRHGQIGIPVPFFKVLHKGALLLAVFVSKNKNKWIFFREI